MPIDDILIRIADDTAYTRGRVDSLIVRQSEDHKSNQKCIEDHHLQIYGNGKWGLKTHMIIVEVALTCIGLLVLLEYPKAIEAIKILKWW